MVKKMHVSQSGVSAGTFVECKANIRCRIGGEHVEPWNLANAAEYLNSVHNKRLQARHVTKENYAEYVAASASVADAATFTDTVDYVEILAKEFRYLEQWRESETSPLTVDFGSVSLYTSSVSSDRNIYGLKNIQVTGPAGKVRLFKSSVEKLQENKKFELQGNIQMIEIVLDKEDFDKIKEDHQYVFSGAKIVEGSRGIFGFKETVTVTVKLKDDNSSYSQIKTFVESQPNSSFKVVDSEKFNASKPDYPVTDNVKIVEQHESVVAGLNNVRSVLLKNQKDQFLSKELHYVNSMLSDHLPKASILFNEMLDKANSVEQRSDLEVKFAEILSVIEKKTSRIHEDVLSSDKRFAAHLDFMKDISS